jgi:hypothetical protein
MKRRKGITFSLISGGMEICWLCAWAAFSMTAIMGKPFPVIEAIITFVLAAVLTRISFGKGWRIIQVGVLHILGFACAALGIVYAVYYSSSYLLVDTGWLFALFHQPRNPVEWIILVLIFIWVLLFWIGGYTQSKRPRIYFTVCGRFDLGLAAFFCLFLVKIALLEKGGIKVNDPFSSSLIFPFFLLSLLAIGMTSIEHKAPTRFLPGYRGIGIIVTFVAIVLLYAGAVSLFFLPFLTAVADTGYMVLKGGAGLVLPVIERVLRFVFMGGRGVREDPASSSPKSDEWIVSSYPHGPWVEFIEKVIKWGIESLALILLIVGCALILYFLIRWLLSRTRHVTGVTMETLETISWFIRLWNILVLLYRRALLGIRGYTKASEVYAVLLRWGQRSGLVCFIHETPLEFGERLNKYFPQLKPETDLIISAFNREVYGEANMSGEAMEKALSAWRVLRSPRHWPLRLKIRFFNSGSKEY